MHLHRLTVQRQPVAGITTRAHIPLLRLPAVSLLVQEAREPPAQLHQHRRLPLVSERFVWVNDVALSELCTRQKRQRDEQPLPLEVGRKQLDQVRKHIYEQLGDACWHNQYQSRN